MLTSIPARVLHQLRDLAAALLVLADLGLELLCDEHDHDGALHELEHGGYDLATDLADQGLRACCGLPSAVHCL